MKRSRLYPVIISAAALLLASWGIAESGEDERVWSIKSSKVLVDTPITEIEEIRASQSRRLEKLDEDDDGNVSREEFRAGARSQREEREVSIEAIEEIVAEAVEDIDIEGIKERVLSWREDGLPLISPSQQRRIIIRKAHGEEILGDVEVDDLDIDVSFGSFRDQSRDATRYHWSNSDPSEWFDIVDANEDGVLDRDEVAGAREQMRNHRLDQRFDMLDANKDGQLNDEDIDARLKKLQALDEDGDGSISRRELREVMRLLGENRMLERAHVKGKRRDNGHR